MSKRGVHGSPRSGAALAPYKHFAEQYLGAGAIHLPRAFEISQDSIKITTPNGVVIFMSCVDKKDTFAKHCATRLCGISMKIFQKSKSDFRTPDQ